MAPKPAKTDPMPTGVCGATVKDWLATHPLGELSIRQSALVERTSDLCVFEKGSTLYSEGSPRQYIYCILSGTAIQKRGIPGKVPIVVSTVGPGQVLGLLSFESEQPYLLTSEALSELETVRIPVATVKQLWKSNPQLAYRVANWLMLQLEDTYRAISESGFSRVDKRIFQALLNLSKPSGPRGEALQIDFPLTRREIAELSHTTVETSIRTMKRWEHLGWITTERKRITISSPNSLRADVEGDGSLLHPKK